MEEILKNTFTDETSIIIDIDKMKKFNLKYLYDEQRSLGNTIEIQDYKKLEQERSD